MAEPEHGLGRVSTYYVAWCSICESRVPFGNREKRREWSEAHQTAVHHGHEGEDVRITYWMETR